MMNSIQKTVELKAPIERVWRALSVAEEFGNWFGVRLEGPFELGQIARGKITHPGYEHLIWQAEIVRMDPPCLFAFTWHPYAIDVGRDYSSEPSTLVEFRLEAVASGTRLTLTESGFDALPPERRDEAFRMNLGGWEQQMKNVEGYVQR